MTREEILKIVVLARKVNDELFERVENDEIQGYADEDVVEGILEKLDNQPLFPSDVDKAVVEWIRNLKDSDAIYTKDAFKAGAEWDAKQGVSMKVTDDTEWDDIDTFVRRNVNGKAIIQIRKV